MAEAKRVDTMRISLREKLAYSLGDIASNVVWSAAGGFLTYYYTNVAGIAAAAAGVIMLSSRLLDGVSDVAMGGVIDKTKSRFGKARPWLLWMCGPFALASFLLFAVPRDWDDTAKIIYAFITYNFMSTVVYTAINLPYGVMNAMMTDNQKDRTSLNIFRMLGAMTMAVCANLLVIPLVKLFGGGSETNPTGWTMTFSMLGIIAMCLFILCFLGTKERIRTEEAKDKEHTSLIKAVSLLFRNKFWVILLITGVIAQMGVGTMGVNPYYAQYYLGDVGLAGLMSMFIMVPLVIGLAISGPLIEKFGKRNCILFGVFFGLPGYILPLFNPYSFVFIAIGGVFRGLGMGPAVACGFAMLADVIDYHDWKFGARTEGVVYSAASFGNKVGMGLGAAALGVGLSLGRFDGAAGASQPGSAMAAILIVYAILPLVLQIIGIVLYSQYTLDKIYPQIVAELAERKKQSV
ncbi:MAG: glycoside-pentoside-hexuronide (GPH):cation symporter [Treponema sp.]|jgi:GPH family glycoside/pentoside/hexuronide:cation symporter|nr:glycoside-pentoside-hexuronide (GPH):cation symporter [Treponema sp.]